MMENSRGIVETGIVHRPIPISDFIIFSICDRSLNLPPFDGLYGAAEGIGKSNDPIALQLC